MSLIVFNPDYFIRHDIKRTFIINKYLNNNGTYGWYSMIHPVHAMVFSFFTRNRPYDETVLEIAQFLSMSTQEVNKLINPFIENDENVYVTLEGTNFNLPKNILIKSDKAISYEFTINPEDFVCSEYDFKSKRYLKAPLNMTFMPNNRCVTNCVYCYADKQHSVRKPIPFNRLKQVIDEAAKLKVLNFSLVGGEIFTYKYWKELIKYLKEHKFQITRISTKVPINRDDIVYLKSIGINEIQISIDSLIENEMKFILDVKQSYVNKIKSTLRMLAEEDFDIQIATIVTKFNCNQASMQSIYQFIKEINAASWNVSPGFESLYRPQQSFRAEKEDLYTLFEYLEILKERKEFSLNIDKTFIERNYGKFKNGSETFEGATCSALCSHIFILPDGKVTMCEQLYWNPFFIIGDLTTQNIEEVWNSERAHWFLNLKPNMLQSSNPCSSCEIFERCYNNMNRCWTEVIKAYGQENWDYPDPRCSLAPEMINDLNF